VTVFGSEVSVEEPVPCEFVGEFESEHVNRVIPERNWIEAPGGYETERGTRVAFKGPELPFEHHNCPVFGIDFPGWC
jgi:hypothetical protein